MSARSFCNKVTLTLFEGNPTYAYVLDRCCSMHVQLDNTKQNLSAPKTIAALKPGAHDRLLFETDFGEHFTGKRSTLFLPTFEDFFFSLFFFTALSGALLVKYNINL